MPQEKNSQFALCHCFNKYLGKPGIELSACISFPPRLPFARFVKYFFAKTCLCDHLSTLNRIGDFFNKHFNHFRIKMAAAVLFNQGQGIFFRPGFTVGAVTG